MKISPQNVTIMSVKKGYESVLNAKTFAFSNPLQYRLYFVYFKPCRDIVSNLLVIDLQLNGLQKKFQPVEYFYCDPLIPQPIVIRFSNSLYH